jgi:hypothetical protein
MPKRSTLAVLAVLVSLAAASAEETYPTNIELVEQAVRQAADSMDVRPPAVSAPHLGIETDAGGEVSWLLDSVLKKHLLGLGWRIRAEAEPGDTVTGDGGGFLLKLRVVELGLNYGRSWRRYVLGGKFVQRIARVSIYYELVNLDSDHIDVSSSVRAEASDVVPASMLPALSSSKYGFASPELGKNRWDRYLEGGLVIAIVGVLIYLFYSNKTAS